MYLQYGGYTPAKRKWLIIVALCLFSLVTHVPLVFSASVWTDEPQYLKGDTAHIFGFGFTPYTPIQIRELYKEVIGYPVADPFIYSEGLYLTTTYSAKD